MSKYPRPVTAWNTLGKAVQVRKVRLTNTQFKECRATPVELVPAPGTGRAIVVESVDMLIDASAAAYTESTDNLAVEYSGGTDILTIEATGFVDQAAVEFRTVKPAVSLTEPVENEAVELFNSGDGEFGGGNAANYVEVTVRYRVVDVA